jgi:hypothetical protein
LDVGECEGAGDIENSRVGLGGLGDLGGLGGLGDLGDLGGEEGAGDIENSRVGLGGLGGLGGLASLGDFFLFFIKIQRLVLGFNTFPSGHILGTAVFIFINTYLSI